MDRKKVIKLFSGFLAVMLIFTILSRAVSGASMARVETVKIATGPIEHKVTASGRVEAGKEIAMYTESGQRVREICVQEGESVEEGDVLFRLDVEELNEQITAAQQELEKAKLQNQDVQNAKAFEQSNQQTAKQRAQEDYNQAVAQGDASVAEAKRVWDEAERALQDFLNSSTDAGNGGADVQNGGTDILDPNGGQSGGNDDGDKADGNSGGADEQSSGEGPGCPDGQSAEGNAGGTDNLSAQDGQAGANGTDDREAQKASLEQAVAEAKAAYDAAVSARADNIKSTSRSLADASRPQSAADTAQKQNEITRQQQELALNKLLSLQEAEGEVKATASGIITQILVSTGDFTSEGAAVRIADTAQGGRLVLSVDKMNEEYVSKGSPVKLKVSGSKEEITDYTVTSIAENEQDNTLLDVTVELPQGVIETGTLVNAEITPKTETYNSVVPLQALHEEQNGCYVLVLQEEQGVLGTQLVVKRLDVQVVDKNNTNAALEEGLLTSEQEIVSSASRSIQEGSRVRRKES